MVTDQELAAIIKKSYRYDRLEGRDNDAWGKDYSKRIISSRLEDIHKTGSAFISKHESVTGEAVRVFDNGAVI